MKKFLSIQALSAFVLIALGATVMTGWILRNPAMVQIRPTAGATVFSAALCFVLLGIALLLPILKPRATAAAQTAIGYGLVAIASLVFLEYLAGRSLLIDLPAVHAWLNDGNPNPGRAAPGAGLAFMLSGFVLVMMQRVRSRRTGIAIVAATFVVLLWGLVCLASYFLHLDLLYSRIPAVRMPIQTGIGLIVCGVGLWSHWRNAEWYRTQHYFKHDEKIGLVAVTMLTVIAVAAGVVGFAVQQATLERTLSENLLSHLKHQTALFHAIVGQNVAHVESAAQHSDLIRLVRSSERPADASGAARELDLIGRNLLAGGLRGVALYDRNNRRILHRGSFGRAPQIETDLGLSTPTSLRWDGTYFLNTRVDIVDEGRIVGVLEAEHPLPLITKQFANDKGLGATGEMGMCISRPADLWCFPQYRNPTVYSIPRLRTTATLTAMAYAVAGQSGIFKGLDYRRHQVIAAYGPLTSTGLGIVIKQDTEELYQPIREQLQWYLPLLLVVVAGGAMVLRAQVKPLVSKLFRSERDAIDQEAHMRAVIDNVAEGIITLNEQGMIESFNPAASRIFGYSVAEAAGMDMQTLMPARMRAAHKAGMRRFVDGGEAHIIGNRSVELPGLHKDGTVITLELAINELQSGERRLFVGIVRDVTARKETERALQESEARFREITETLGEGVLLLDRNGMILFSNLAAQRLLGWTEQELCGRHGHTLYHHTRADGTPYPAHECEIDNAVRSGKSFLGHDEIFWRKDGSRLPVSVNSTPIRRDGAVAGEVLAFHDIVKRKQAEQALTAESAKNAMLLRTASDGIHVLDSEGNVELANDAFCRMLGYAPEAMQHMNVAQWEAQWSPGQLREKLDALLDSDELFETRHRRCDGSIVDVEIHAAGVVIDGKRLLYASARDISERKRAAQQLHHLAHFDILTDLPNRALLHDRMQQALAKAKRDKSHLALLFIDLDQFKPVNDTLGHHIGDLLLKEVAQRLRHCLRDSDTVARVGGDEFVVLLPQIHAEQDAMGVADKILQALNQAFDLAGHALHVSASIGIAAYPEHGNDEEQLMSNADSAMYRAKESGGAATVSFGPLQRPAA